MIVGAGITGLTLSDLWSSRGVAHAVVEREYVPGGLARSVPCGDLLFDLGPHRFYSSDPWAAGYIDRVLADNQVRVRRRTSIHLAGRDHEWPPTSSTLRTIPKGLAVRAGLEILRRHGTEADNFERFIQDRWGTTLRDAFFNPMVEKFYRMPARCVAPEWASAGIDRAIIEDRNGHGVLRYLASHLLGRRPPLSFVYPAHGGIQAFANAQAERAVGSGECMLRTGVRVTGLETSDGHVTGLHLSDGTRLPTDFVVWTAPLDLLWSMLYAEPPGLEFVSTVFYNLVLKTPSPKPEQWVYLPERRYSVLRASYPKNFARKGHRNHPGVCAEITARTGDAILDNPEAALDSVVDDLVRVGAVKHSRDIVHTDHVVVPDTYPLYSVGFQQRLDTAMQRLARVSNLFLLGRCGMFWYNNMDGSMRGARDFDQWLRRLGRLPGAEEKTAFAERVRRTQ